MRRASQPFLSRWSVGLACVCVSALPRTAVAASVGSAPAEASTPSQPTSEPAASEASDNATPWLRRHPPRRHTGELGVWGGALLPSTRHELFDADVGLPDQGFRRLAVASGIVGLRVGYYPARVFGLEMEGAFSPTQTRDTGRFVALWGARGQFVLQLPWWSLTPFVLGGVGALGVSSDREALGDDADLAVHFGGGLKLFVHRRVVLRIDARDYVSARRGVRNGLAHMGEFTAGIGLVLGRSRASAEPIPRDRDRDGFRDRDDGCPDTAGIAPDGCPPSDRDGDGFVDAHDACPTQVGVAPQGCPIPDSDNDGFSDPEDRCPHEPGVAPDGCPHRDTDDDGFLDHEDACVDAPETHNGFEDEDGCPDVVPDDVEAYSGVIAGIYFDSNRAVVRPTSKPTLDAAVDILRRFPSISIEISGHTDARGDRTYNMDLSARRAEAVRAYLIEHGIEADRIQTRGAGPDEPIDTNRTAKGRARNRRIEFHVLQ